jgi:hypothetical protein
MVTQSRPAKAAAKQEALQAALDSADKLRRHMRIIVDLGRLASQQLDVSRFFDQAVVQVARAVEIKHVKILQYRRQTSDLLQVAGIGWKEGVVGNATFPASLKSPPGRAYQTGEPVIITDGRNTTEFRALTRAQGARDRVSRQRSHPRRWCGLGSSRGRQRHAS